MPESEVLDLIGYRAIALGFIFLTLVMITGAIWAERAWGITGHGILKKHGH